MVVNPETDLQTYHDNFDLPCLLRLASPTTCAQSWALDMAQVIFTVSHLLFLHRPVEKHDPRSVLINFVVLVQTKLKDWSTTGLSSRIAMLLQTLSSCSRIYFLSRKRSYFLSQDLWRGCDPLRSCAQDVTLIVSSSGPLRSYAVSTYSCWEQEVSHPTNIVLYHHRTFMEHSSVPETTFNS